MHSSNYWLGHFKASATQQRIDWETPPDVLYEEIKTITTSMQAWQLGETLDDRRLIAASARYAGQINDPVYTEVIKLFIKEEQRHGENLGRYLDAIGQPHIRKNWGDSVFRFVRHLTPGMEAFTLAVLTAESFAQIYYQALKEATGCPLLKNICTDILIDEAFHITFQTERMALIYAQKGSFGKFWRRQVYHAFFYATAVVIWLAHQKVLKAGGCQWDDFLRKADSKYHKTIKRATLLPAFRFAC